MRIEHAFIGRLNADGDISLLLLNCRLQIGIRHLHEAELLAGQGAANDIHFQTLARTLDDVRRDVERDGDGQCFSRHRQPRETGERADRTHDRSHHEQNFARFHYFTFSSFTFCRAKLVASRRNRQPARCRLV